MSYLHLLESIEWVEGSHIPLPQSSYRHRIVIACSQSGRQRAKFANGQFPYFAYTELLNGKGKWISHGSNIVPILSDNRFLMVIEQRPTLGRYVNHPRTARVYGMTIDLGPYGSLEFPGGAVESGEEFTAGFLRELAEETGIDQQQGLLYRRLPVVYSFGSDIALAMFYNVIYLSGFSFPDYVDDDGGLSVYALRRAEVEYNVLTGAIASGQAALHGWNFYQEVERAHQNRTLLDYYTQVGYMSVQEVTIKKVS